MAASYLRRGMDGPATFSLYVRDMPKERGFLVAAGLDDCLRYLEDFSFDENELLALSGMGFDRQAIHDFADVRFEGEVWAVPEGRIVHAKEPILEVTAPIAQAQLVETALLNQVTLHTTIASKAARYVIAAEGRGLVDFAFRRTHGFEAARAAARGSAIVGFRATSNVDAARELDLEVSGTMAHAFVTAFDDERDAFRAFAEDHPHRTTFLVDTYDTVAGVQHAVEVIQDMKLPGPVGVRLDSGRPRPALAEVRRILDHAGLRRAKIFASGGLDEHEVAELVRAGAPVDAFGIGTQMGVSADALRGYRLQARRVRRPARAEAFAREGDGPRREAGVARAFDDIIGLRSEAAPGPHHEPLLEPVMRAGRRLSKTPSIAEMRTRFERDLAALPVKASRLTHPEHVVAHRSEALAALTAQTAEAARRRIRASD